MKQLGVSAYISNLKNLKYLEKARKDNVERVFISLHIPEEVDSKFKEKASLLIDKVLSMGFKHVMCDISKLGIEALGMSTNNLDWLYEQGIECRLDYGFSKEEIAKLTKKYKIWINASTATEDILKEISSKGNINNVSSSHDFYPLPGSGLSPEQLIAQDNLLRSFNIKTISSFIPGIKNFRPPMFSGLPTLENTRNINQLDSFLKLKDIYNHDYIYIGDPDYSKLKSFKYKNTVIIENKNILDKTKYELRVSNSLLRLKGTRIMSHSESGPSKVKVRKVRPIKSVIKVGDIAILNSNSKRYEGEVCIIVSSIDKNSWNMFNKIGELKNPKIDIPLLTKNKVIKIKRA